MGSLGRKMTRIDLQSLGIESVRHLSCDRQMRGKREGRKRSPLVARVIGVGRARRLERRRHGRDIGRRRHGDLPLASTFDKSSERPFQQVAARRRAGEAQACQPLEIAEGGDVDVRVGRLES